MRLSVDNRMFIVFLQLLATSLALEGSNEIQIQPSNSECLYLMQKEWHCYRSVHLSWITNRHRPSCYHLNGFLDCMDHFDEAGCARGINPDTLKSLWMKLMIKAFPDQTCFQRPSGSDLQLPASLLCQSVEDLFGFIMTISRCVNSDFDEMNPPPVCPLVQSKMNGCLTQQRQRCFQPGSGMDQFANQAQLALMLHLLDEMKTFKDLDLVPECLADFGYDNGTVAKFDFFAMNDILAGNNPEHPTFSYDSSLTKTLKKSFDKFTL